MIIRYLLIMVCVASISGCQSKYANYNYDSNANDYESCKKMLSDKSHSIWDQPEPVQELEISFCNQLILDAEFYGALEQADREKQEKLKQAEQE